MSVYNISWGGFRFSQVIINYASDKMTSMFGDKNIVQYLIMQNKLIAKGN